MKGFYQWYRKHITGAIFAGLILGILTGLFLADKFEVVLTATSALGSIYMNALNMMIFPLVFCSIVMGIASIGSAVFFVYNSTCKFYGINYPKTHSSWTRRKV